MVLEVMVMATLWHRREKSAVALRFEHPFHVDMIEGLLAELAPIDGGHDLLLDGR
jgi:hypothetical protein